MSFLKRHGHLWPWAAVIAMGALLRLKLLTVLGTPWFDEAFSWHFAQKPAADIVRLMLMDVHPPLHMLVLHFWMRLFGDGVTTMRLLSALTAVGGLIAFAALGNALVGKKPAFLALFLAAFSPVMVYYGADARMYAAVFALSCLSSWLFWRAVGRGGDGRKAWFWATLALALVHVTGVFVIAGQAAFLLSSRERRAMFRKFLPQYVLIAAVFSAWLLPAAAFRLPLLSKEWQFRSGQDNLGVLPALLYWIRLDKDPLKFAIAAVVAGLLIIAAIMRRSERRPHFTVTPESAFLLWWLLATIAPFAVFPNVTPRYLTAAVPPFFLLLAKGFMNAGAARRSTLLLGLLFVMMLSFTGLAVQFEARPYDWDLVVDWIAARYQPGDRVVFGWFADRLAVDATAAPPFNRDISRFDMRGLYPFDDALDEDGRLAAHAGTLAVSKADLDRLDPLFSGATRVFFIPNYYLTVREGGLAVDSALNDWFLAHGWYLADRKDVEGRTQGVWMMVRKK